LIIEEQLQAASVGTRRSGSEKIEKTSFAKTSRGNARRKKVVSEAEEVRQVGMRKR